MNDCKYLLYIDILGFSELVKHSPQTVKVLFGILDNLNAHRHHAFQTIVFSDTILIFSKHIPSNEHDHNYLVMYSCEFIQDLMFKTINLGIQFRAILTYDEFYYYDLNNLEAYYGNALINCYNKEKQINAQGLFIDKRINHLNRIFPTADFDEDLLFVYLLQSIETLHLYGEFDRPIDKSFVSEGYEFFGLEDDVKILENLHAGIERYKDKDSRIRGKYLETYHQYQKRYKWLITLFEENGFDHKIVSPDADWSHLKRGTS